MVTILNTFYSQLGSHTPKLGKFDVDFHSLLSDIARKVDEPLLKDHIEKQTQEVVDVLNKNYHDLQVPYEDVDRCLREGDMLDFMMNIEVYVTDFVACLRRASDPPSEPKPGLMNRANVLAEAIDNYVSETDGFKTYCRELLSWVTLLPYSTWQQEVYQAVSKISAFANDLSLAATDDFFVSIFIYCYYCIYLFI